MKFKLAGSLIIFTALVAVGQKPEPHASTPKASAPTAPKLATASSSSVVTPKESASSLKLDLALEKEKSIALRAQLIQNSIEPQMTPLRHEYQEQEQIVSQESITVKKDNGWGNDVNIDRNPQSPSYGKWVKTETKK